jgi:uncharacterized ion transporter superfamily protein YfcC
MTTGGIIFIIVCLIIIVGLLSWVIVAGGHKEYTNEEYTNEEKDDEV